MYREDRPLAAWQESRPTGRTPVLLHGSIATRRIAVGLLLCGMGLLACQPARPTHAELIDTFGQAFSSFGKPEELTVLGTLPPFDDSTQEPSIVWLVHTVERPIPEGTITSRIKIPLDSLQGLIEAVQYESQEPPQIEGKQCEFVEWKNPQGVWRMRLAVSTEGFVLTLEHIEHSVKGGES